MTNCPCNSLKRAKLFKSCFKGCRFKNHKESKLPCALSFVFMRKKVLIGAHVDFKSLFFCDKEPKVKS